MPHLISQLLNLLVLRDGAGLERALSSDQFGVLCSDFIHFLYFRFVLVDLGLQLVDLAVLILDHLLFTFCVHDCLIVLLVFALCNLEFFDQILCFFLTTHQSHMQVIFLFTFLIQNVLLFIESLL